MMVFLFSQQAWICLNLQATTVHWCVQSAVGCEFACGAVCIVLVPCVRTVCPSGPSDVSVHWHSNGRRLNSRVTEHRHALAHDAVLVSSWVMEEPLGQDAQYQCVAVSRSGNDTSKVDLLLSSRDEANVFSKELNQWREALVEHDTHLQNWKKAWEGCDGQGVL